MSDDVIIMVADDAYLPHAKSVMVNCRRQGEWEGDFCLLAPEGADNADVERRGISVLRVPHGNWTHLIKFWIFTPYFRKWKRALCIDLDIMVQRNLQRVFDGLGQQLPAILCNLEDGDIIGSWKHWDTAEGTGPEAHPELYEKMLARYPHVTQRMFNMAFIFFAPESMPPETIDELQAVAEEFKEANPSNADQMITNLVLYDRMAEATKEYFHFFGFDEPGNRIQAASRNWKGDEFPSLVHYCRWSAPWIVKPSQAPKTEMGGYRNSRLDRVCHELYAENLAAFEDVFPVRG